VFVVVLILRISIFLLQVVIEGIAGSSYTGDIAIDTITVVNGACGSPSGI